MTERKENDRPKTTEIPSKKTPHQQERPPKAK